MIFHHITVKSIHDTAFCQMTEYIYIALSDLVLICFYFKYIENKILGIVSLLNAKAVFLFFVKFLPCFDFKLTGEGDGGGKVNRRGAQLRK